MSRPTKGQTIYVAAALTWSACTIEATPSTSSDASVNTASESIQPATLNFINNHRAFMLDASSIPADVAFRALLPERKLSGRPITRTGEPRFVSTPNSEVAYVTQRATVRIGQAERMGAYETYRPLPAASEATSTKPQTHLLRLVALQRALNTEGVAIRPIATAGLEPDTGLPYVFFEERAGPLIRLDTLSEAYANGIKASDIDTDDVAHTAAVLEARGIRSPDAVARQLVRLVLTVNSARDPQALMRSVLKEIVDAGKVLHATDVIKGVPPTLAIKLSLQPLIHDATGRRAHITLLDLGKSVTDRSKAFDRTFREQHGYSSAPNEAFPGIARQLAAFFEVP